MADATVIVRRETMKPTQPFDGLSDEEIAGRLIDSLKTGTGDKPSGNIPGVGPFGLTRRVDVNKAKPPQGDFEKPHWSDE